MRLRLVTLDVEEFFLKELGISLDDSERVQTLDVVLTSERDVSEQQMDANEHALVLSSYRLVFFGPIKALFLWAS